MALAARELRAAGPQAVVVTLGADRLWALTADGSWHAEAVVAGAEAADELAARQAVEELDARHAEEKRKTS